ncbi:MAG TPA: CHASE2 domain-containing protein, partial [Methylophilaceae bacterium]|nr:CHASE2 domain-containing protein [Methylophilaceae bacterium]
MKRFKLQRYSLLAMMLAMVLLADIFWLHTFAPLENRLSDVMVARHALNSVPDADIIIVDIDERSLSLMADSVGRWPWPRSLHAELVEGIERQRPKALVFDILFSDADLARPEGDQYFADAIRANNNLYFPMLRLNDANQSSGIPLAQYGAALGIMAGPAANPKARVSLVLPLPAMVESGRIGVHNAVADNDGVVRGYPLYLDDEGWHIPSLPARVATGLGYTLPGGSDIVLNWHGRALSYQRVSYAEIYADLQ